MTGKRAMWLVLVPALGCGLISGAWGAAKPGQAGSAGWVGTWAAAPVSMPPGIEEPAAGNSTYRDIVHISAGGSGVRVQLTNEFGSTPLVVSAAHIAVSAGNGAIEPGSDHALTFGGRADVMVPAGGFILSDEVPMEAAAFANLAVSVYVADRYVSTRTCHVMATSTNYIARGDQTAAPSLDNARTIPSWCFVKGIEVRAREGAFSTVVLGASIADGYHSTPNENRRWPDDLAARLQASRPAVQAGVLNEGMGGNRLLHDGTGPGAIARFDRDVLAQSGVRDLILFEGTNDLGWPAAHGGNEPVTAEEMIWAETQLVERAHQHGIRVLGSTLTPFEGASYFSAQGEQIRTAFNAWVRTGGVVDGVIDFDKVARDPARPARLLPAFDSGDHLHPDDAGYKAMADSIDLSLLR